MAKIIKWDNIFHDLQKSTKCLTKFKYKQTFYTAEQQLSYTFPGSRRYDNINIIYWSTLDTRTVKTSNDLKIIE